MHDDESVFQFLYRKTGRTGQLLQLPPEVTIAVQVPHQVGGRGVLLRGQGHQTQLLQEVLHHGLPFARIVLYRMILIPKRRARGKVIHSGIAQVVLPGEFVFLTLLLFLLVRGGFFPPLLLPFKHFQNRVFEQLLLHIIQQLHRGILQQSNGQL